MPFSTSTPLQHSSQLLRLLGHTLCCMQMEFRWLVPESWKQQPTSLCRSVLGSRVALQHFYHPATSLRRTGLLSLQSEDTNLHVKASSVDVALQAGMAKAELEAAEKAQRSFKKLSRSVREALHVKALRWRAAAGSRAEKLGAAVRATAHRVVKKLPVRGDGAGTMVIDVKALKRIVMRCGIMGLWF